LAGVAAQRFYAFTPPGQTSATTWAAPAAYPQYVQTAYAPQSVPSAQYEQAEEWSMSNAVLLIGAGAAGAAAGMALKRPLAALAVSADADDSKQAVAVGAACVGGILGVFFFHELSTAVILALIFAYGSTKDNGFGNATRKAGDVYNQVYDKTVALNEEYEILNKAKSAADFTVAATVDLDQNYQLSSRVDEKLKLSQAYDKAKTKFDEVTEQFPQKISQKVEDLKTRSIEVD